MKYNESQSSRLPADLNDFYDWIDFESQFDCLKSLIV